MHGRLRDWAHLRLGSLAVRSISNASVIFLHSYSGCSAWSGVEHNKCSRLLRSSIHARPFGTTRLCGLLLLLHLAPPIPVHRESDWTDYHGSVDLQSDPRPVSRQRSNQSMKPTAPNRNALSVFATAPSTSSRFPASLVRFTSLRSRTPAVLFFNDSRGLSFSR